MVKIVVDTNTIMAGMMGYRSFERILLSYSLSKKMQFVGCNQTLKEFSEKVKLPRLQRYWQKYYFSADKVIQDYLALVVMHEPTPLYLAKDIPIRDPKDAIFIKLALSSGSKIIVSKDGDLLVLDGYEGLKIVCPEKFVQGFQKIHSDQPLTVNASSK